MTDSKGRNGQTGGLPQFRVLVNSRCGRACFFCRPSGEGIPTAAHQQLEPDEVFAVAEELKRLGIRASKITGGDPALYEPLTEVIQGLHDRGFDSIEVISRHPSIALKADALATAGATLFNVSLDTLDAEKHRAICGVDDHSGVVAAIDALVASGVPTKVNVVVMKGVNDDELTALVEFAEERGVSQIKFLDVIEDLDQGSQTFSPRLTRHIPGAELRDLYYPLADLVRTLSSRAIETGIVSQGGLGHPMTSIRLHSRLNVLVKDASAGAWYGPICKGCRYFPCHDALMALRLTSDMRLQFCLLREDHTIPLRGLSRTALHREIRGALSVYSEAEFLPGSQVTTKPAYSQPSSLVPLHVRRRPSKS